MKAFYEFIPEFECIDVNALGKLKAVSLRLPFAALRIAVAFEGSFTCIITLRMLVRLKKSNPGLDTFGMPRICVLN